MQQALANGQTIFVTRQLADDLIPKGFNDLMLYEPTHDKALVSHFDCEWEYCSYHHYAESSKKILLSRLGFKTNDSQNLISGLEGENNYPLIVLYSQSEHVEDYTLISKEPFSFTTPPITVTEL